MESNIFFECIHNVFLARRKVGEKIAKEYDLSLIDMEILSCISFNSEEATATAIQHARKFKKNTISVHVENLVRQGLLERREKEADRRKVMLSLTNKAVCITDAWMKENELLTQKLKEGVTEEEFKILSRCFGIVNENAMRVLKS